jgi:GNAT superfamily N-acetyltransferase
MLRAGRDADAADVIALIGACWADYPGCVMDLDGEVPELRALATHAAGHGGAMWVWEDAGRVAGVVCVWPRQGGDWELAKMYVAAHLRGSGVAGALIAAAEGHARAGGAARMRLWTDTRFDRAHRFYEKHSYVRHGPLRVLDDRSNSIEFAYAKPLIGAVVAPLDAAAAESAVAPLAGVLTACVAAGATVSFMAPLSVARARAFWRDVARGVARGERYLFAAWLEGRIVGTVQLVLIQKENQPHRAEIEKMLVHPDARRRGLGARLLAAAEDTAAASGRWLLTLDTGPRGGAGEKLYRAAGWQEAGTIPCSSLSPDGSFCDTTFFYKRLLQPTQAAGGTLPAAAPG